MALGDKADLLAAPPDTGGVDLGPMGAMHGRVMGFNALSSVAADAAPLFGAKLLQRKAAKDFNDDPTTRTDGTNNGRPVEEI